MANIIFNYYFALTLILYSFGNIHTKLSNIVSFSFLKQDPDEPILF